MPSDDQFDIIDRAIDDDPTTTPAEKAREKAQARRDFKLLDKGGYGMSPSGRMVPDDINFDLWDEHNKKQR